MKKFIHIRRDAHYDPFKTRAQNETRVEVVDTLSDALAVVREEDLAMVLRAALVMRTDLQTSLRAAQELERKLYMEIRHAG